MTTTVKDTLQQALRADIRQVSPLSGGDINDVYLLETTAGRFVVKLNSASRYPGMFPAEAEGLAALGNTRAIQVPAVVAQGEAGETAYLVLEYMEQGNPDPGFWEAFGQQLAALHRNTANRFGFKHSNYIGSLPQYNAYRATAVEFYITQRLQPQFRMAHDQGHRFDTEALYKNLETLIPDEQPALVHGDLWNGNYLVSKDGASCLIDPAVAYAHRETDIAMMHLFGGFPPAMIRAYNATFRLSDGWKERLEVWQLYYLLVHLNLFGVGYLQAVGRIVRKYS